MHALKDKISEKLSELFSDSPSHSPTHGSDQRPQAKLEGRSLSAISPFTQLSFKKPTTVERTDEGKPIDSNSFFWRMKSFPLRDKPVERHSDYDHKNGPGVVAQEENGVGRQSAREEKEVSHACTENGDLLSERLNSSDLEVFVDTPDRQSFGTSMHNLLKESAFMSMKLFDFFEACLPNIVKGCQWVSLYRAVHRHMVYRCVHSSAGVTSIQVLACWYIPIYDTLREIDERIAGDKKGAIFGGLLECPLRPTAKRKYQGTSQTFVFTTIYGEPRLFRPTGANRYYIMCLKDLLAFGGGSNFALSMEEDLLCGTSGPCDTFGNSCLAHDREFELKNVELWGFKHASNYLT